MWTWNEIDAEWLTAERTPDMDPILPSHVFLGHSPDDVVAVFNTVDERFGRSWIETVKSKSRFVPGTLLVFAIGKLLVALDGVRGADRLIDKLRAGDAAARSECEALYLIRRGQEDITAEYEPVVSIAGHEAAPDFRVRADEGEQWTYVEVVSPDPSVLQRAATATAERLAMVATDIPGPVAVELALNRDPTAAEIVELERQLHAASRQTGGSRGDLEETLEDGLGRLTLNFNNLERVNSQAGLGPAVVIGVARLGGKEPQGRATITVTFSDARAAQFLRLKARQLPCDAPGILMLDVSRVVGGQRNWGTEIAARLRPDLYTRVSAVCLFEPYTIWRNGFVWGVAASCITNAHSRFVIPNWLGSSLAAWPSMREVMSSAG